MTAMRILAEAARSGINVELCGTDLAISGFGARPGHLMTAIRAAKAEIVFLLRARANSICRQSEVSEESVTSSGNSLPPWDLPVPVVLPAIEPANAPDLINRVFQHGKQAVGWCMVRANAYFQEFPETSFQYQDAAAASDFLRWQRRPLATG